MVHKNYLQGYACVLVFCVIFIFFAIGHPYLPYDADDWLYLSKLRVPWPSVSEWNPSRVLQELLMPLNGWVAAYIIYPWLEDYMLSITYATAFFMALFCTVFFQSLQYLFDSILADKKKAALWAAFFFSLYFLIFYSRYNTQYLLYAIDLNCLFSYSIPNLLNSTLICFLIAWIVNQKRKYSKLSLLLIDIGLYFSVFSMTTSSFILVSFMISSVLVKKIRERISLFYLLLPVFIWVLAVLMDLLGSRYRKVGHQISIYDITSALQAFVDLCSDLNVIFLILTAGLFLGFVFKGRKQVTELQSSLYKVLGLSMVICFIFDILLGAKSKFLYCQTAQFMYSVFFYYILLALLAGIFMIKQYSVNLAGIFFIVSMLCLHIFSGSFPNPMYVDSYSLAKQRLTIWQNEIIKANKQEDSEITIHVPKRESAVEFPVLKKKVVPEGPWPHPDGFGEVMMNTLKAHGFISRIIKVNVLADENLP